MGIGYVDFWAKKWDGWSGWIDGWMDGQTDGRIPQKTVTKKKPRETVTHDILWQQVSAQKVLYNKQWGREWSVCDRWDNLAPVVANKTWVSASDHLADKSKLTTYTMFHPAHFVYCLCIVITNFLYNCEACIQSKFCLLPWGKEFQNCLHAFLRLPPFNQDLQPKYKYQLYLIFSKQFISGTHPALLLVCLMQLLLSPAPQ